MAALPYATWMLEQEARALLTRLERVKPFALHQTMLPAAALKPDAQFHIEAGLMQGRRDLRRSVRDFLRWLHSSSGQTALPSVAQRRFALLRLRFNTVLTHFDLFNDALSQRGQNDIGVWLSGLDILAGDALHLSEPLYQAPPVICYLDRGVGAAIRRAWTRLPGGGSNPVAIVRIPRERMIGSGVASSLIHEVGHQAAAILALPGSLRPLLKGMQRGGQNTDVWSLWERWISEIIADFWSIARIGIAATQGLIGVVSLPSAFVFRLVADDPHPPPWIRVKLGCALGQALYPDPQWARLEHAWDAYYPPAQLPLAQRDLFSRILASLPSLVAILTNHRPKRLQGKSLSEALRTHERRPKRLRSLLSRWRREPELLFSAPPCLAFAVIGQARSDGRLTPELESQWLTKLLTHWALTSTLATSAACSNPQTRVARTGFIEFTHLPNLTRRMS